MTFAAFFAIIALAQGGHPQASATVAAAKAPAAVQVTVNGLKFSVDYENPSYLGSPANFGLVVENTGKKNVLYDYPSIFDEFEFSVFDKEKKPVPLTRYGKTIPKATNFSVRGNLQSIRPGGKFKSEFDLMRAFDLSIPGDYTFSVRTKGFMIYDDRRLAVPLFPGTTLFPWATRPLAIENAPLAVELGKIGRR